MNRSLKAFGGAMSTELTISQFKEISISQFTVDHVGRLQSPLPSQIESKSQGKPNGQISTLLLRYYCRAMIPIEAAVVEIQDVPFSGFIKII